MLEAVGIADLEEDLYRSLLQRPRVTVSALATATGKSPARVRKALSSLESKGLASRLPGKEVRFIAAAPDIAVEALVQNRFRELNKLQSDAAELLIQFHQGISRNRLEAHEFVEVVSGRDTVFERFKQVEGTAKQRVMMLNKPPYAHVGLNDLELKQLAAGIEYRVIYDKAALEVPGQIDWMGKQRAAGERARVLAGAPMKLAIADRRVAAVPLYVQQPPTGAPTIEEALIIHPGSLLDALADTFEALWRQALPIRSMPGPGHEETGDGPTDEDRQILICLSAGLTDESIARQLDIATRTVQRRIRRLMELLTADTRFQAGLEAGRRGWV
jgi:predicted transcriptional regulator